MSQAPAQPVWRHPEFRRGALEISVPELEHDLRLARRKSVNVWNPPPQDKPAVVEAKICRVDEDDFSNLRTLTGTWVVDQADVERACRTAR